MSDNGQKNFEQLQAEKISSEAVQQLIAEVETGVIGPNAQKLIILILKSFLYITSLLDEKAGTIKKLIRRIFGLKSERNAPKNPPKNKQKKSPPKPKQGEADEPDQNAEAKSNQDEATDSNSEAPKDQQQQNAINPNQSAAGDGDAQDKAQSKRGGGNASPHSRDDYPGANRCPVNHETLKAGDLCPECLKGRLVVAPPGVFFEWQGQMPLNLNIYDLERLICHTCKKTFTAAVPVPTQTVDDQAAEPGQAVGKVDAFASANAIVAYLRFVCGVPLNRFSAMMLEIGIPISPSNLDRMLRQVNYALRPIYDYLRSMAANADIIMGDDTGIKILEYQADADDDPQSNAKRCLSTVIIAQSGAKRIILVHSGRSAAGKNISKLLQMRKDDLPALLYMSDALAANKLTTDFTVIQGKCWDHARRNFYDLHDQNDYRIQIILGHIKRIYMHDRQTKHMSPEDRLAYHQLHTALLLRRLRWWIVLVKRSWRGHHRGKRPIQPNSSLAKAIKYLDNHWQGLTEFIRIAGMPLSNCLTEQAVKKAIIHRKNSLFYRSKKGAQRGDCLMSIAFTCQYYRVSAFDYFTKALENRSLFFKRPGDFLPWNYRDNLAAMKEQSKLFSTAASF